MNHQPEERNRRIHHARNPSQSSEREQHAVILACGSPFPRALRQFSATSAITTLRLVDANQKLHRGERGELPQSAQRKPPQNANRGGISSLRAFSTGNFPRM
jgi:hypothetical protein